MIFDFYLHINFNYEKFAEYSFRRNPYYKDIKFAESIMSFDFGTVTALYRGNFNDYYYQKNEIHIWIFGYVFTNEKYEAKTGHSPDRVSAASLYQILIDFKQDYLNYLKGNFNIIILNAKTLEVKVITDKLNVLPLYFSISGKNLAISSNTALLLEQPWVNKDIDEIAIYMQVLFDYMLGEYYFVKGIRRCENAIIYTFKKEKVERYKYWDVSSLYQKDLLERGASLDMIASQLKRNVNLYAGQSENVLVSLTGGFDGRTNAAMIEKPVGNFKCYSYGMPGSKQIRIPQEIAKITGIQYEPVLLDKEFLENYAYYTNIASYFSNGTAPVGFSNIPYAYKKLNEYSETVITGLFGSEVLRPLHNNGIQVNNNSFAIFLNDDLTQTFKNIDAKIQKRYVFHEGSLNNTDVYLKDYINEEFFLKYSSFDRVTRFFFFIIQEGIRKYFSQEISIERVYVNTYFPYWDVDFVELIYRTPWAGMYNGFLGASKFKRRKGQLLYAHIIKKYKPELGKIKLDRGYTPNDLLLPFPLNYFKIAVGVYFAKRYMKKVGGNDTFKTREWSSKTINSILQNSDFNTTNILSDSLLREINPIELNDAEFLTYRHFVSIKNFLNDICCFTMSVEK